MTTNADLPAQIAHAKEWEAAARAMLAALEAISEKAADMSGWGPVIEDTAKRAIAAARAAGIEGE